MQYLAVLIVAGLVFGICYLFDKGFEKAFRNKPQHKSGLAVRPNKRYAAFGAILIALGFASIFASAGNTLLLAGGVLILIMGIGLNMVYDKHHIPVGNMLPAIFLPMAYLPIVGLFSYRKRTEASPLRCVFQRCYLM